MSKGCIDIISMTKAIHREMGRRRLWLSWHIWLLRGM